MLDFFWNLGSFILALGILVTVHEYGHFWVARKAGVEVLRFSIGFGKPLYKWYDKLGTEYVLALIPLGGYVKMLDGRVDDVPHEKQHLAFDSKPVLSKIAIVAAGPIANFLFAVFVLAAMYMIGVQSIKPVVGDVYDKSRAQAAQLKAGDEILSIGDEKVNSWQEVTLALMSHLGEHSLDLKVKTAQDQIQLKTIEISNWTLDKQDQPPLESIGIRPFRPKSTLTLAHIESDSAAYLGGLQVNDTITGVSVNGEFITINSWSDFLGVIQKNPNNKIIIEVKRNQSIRQFNVFLQSKSDSSGKLVGYLGVVPLFENWPVGYVQTRQYGPLDSMVLGITKTGELIHLSFSMIGHLITGQISVKNLSGPVGIAVGAGNSVSYGIVAFLSFLALISVNLGVFNLLPLPVLDGGHLMYYIIELIRKKPVSEKTQELGFKVGALLLITLTCFALLNDVSRL